ncbi:MAG: hypothetical protein GY765_39415 [bacterium]|nr:hypothetical protein [bacterium]
MNISDGRARARPARFFLEADILRCEPLRSRYAVYDVLFHSQLEGTIDKRPVRLDSGTVGTRHPGGNDSDKPGTRKAVWTFSNLSAVLASAYIGGPLKYIIDGGIDIRVKNKWLTAGGARIQMDWDVKLTGITLADPDDMGRIARKFAAPIRLYLERHPEGFHYTFSFDIHQESFKYLVSIRSVPLWKRMRTVLKKEMAKRSGKGLLLKAGKKGLFKLKEYIDKKRKK